MTNISRCSHGKDPTTHNFFFVASTDLVFCHFYICPAIACSCSAKVAPSVMLP